MKCVWKLVSRIFALCRIPFIGNDSTDMQYGSETNQKGCSRTKGIMLAKSKVENRW